MKENRLKDNLYVVKSKLKSSNLEYHEIDMCPNFYMLYYLKNTELTERKTNEHPRYKHGTGRGQTLVTHKNLRYFPITPTLQKLFMSPQTIKHMI